MCLILGVQIIQKNVTDKLLVATGDAPARQARASAGAYFIFNKENFCYSFNLLYPTI